MLRTLDSHNELTFKEVVFNKHPYSSNANLTVINIQFHCKLRIGFCSGKLLQNGRILADFKLCVLISSL